MHELSIAQNILEIVQRYVAEQDAGQVRSVRVRIGGLSGIVPESLDFSFSAIVDGTPWHLARLSLEQIEATGHCHDCDSDFAIEAASFNCPNCGKSNIEVTSGTELQVVAIETEDAQS